MSFNKANCLVAQSGGPTSVINASLSGVIEAAIAHKNIDKIYGAVNGVQGVLQHKIIELNTLFEGHQEAIQTLKITPAMFLGSCRYKLPSYQKDDTQYKLIFDVFRKLGIKYFFYIGGNDSMDTVDKLYHYAKQFNFDINIIGIPKTIDNDLFGTDHTPGFGSAAKYVATTLLEIAHDTYIYDIPSVTIVEIMGRNAGWLTAATALARNEYNNAPDLIYLPEVPFSTYDFIGDIKNLLKHKKNIIITVSEGVKDENGQYISATASKTNDLFGHAKLSGTGKALENIVKKSIGCKVRSIELNVLQRSAVHIASLTDIDEAFLVGEKALEYGIEGISGNMMTILRKSNTPYAINISSIPISQVANQEKRVPREWINDKGNDITPALVDYINPLIVGEPSIVYKNGLPQYLPINHLIE